MKKYVSIDEFLGDLDTSKKAQVMKLRETILAVEPSLEECIKWNAPNYAHEGEDRITFNLLNKEGILKLVFHMGALRKEDKKGPKVLEDDQGIVEWASDIRGMVSFASIEDVEAKQGQVAQLVTDWLSLKV